MSEDRPILGIGLMLGFCIVAPLADAVAKLLGQAVPLGEVLLFRFGLQAAILIPLIALTGRIWRMRGMVLWLTGLRTVVHLTGIAMMFTALRYLPLAEAIAITFVMPFFLLILGKFVLGEEVGHRRVIACIVGFAGTLLVVQPSFAQVGWPALLPVGVALNFAVFMLMTRKIAKATDPIGLQAVSGVMAVAIMLPLLAFGTETGLNFEVSGGYEWGLLLAIGSLGTLAHLLMTWSLRYAPSATVAPMQYLEIPFATLIGWLIFSNWPNPIAAAGICVIMAAGLYVLFRERATSRAKPEPPAPSDPTQIAAG
ncbi:DMT family transporter [Lutimaribacter sp. EGI FJ00015]|uniref:DMT family transporter n=1 Tax=Lutimaribacter degradans TaxID=2945989 RepID=A0ACC5ZTB2_9RHOB|nr:DMT family transporter [Lutimaribacter sp. EGI FJ00013]MCM2561415.1 DMT family transporter [Lutimaribacter sp. EGI FJ00013]MCO0612875.1 DMT family transporter [Lutimaribacter sp. EGI FJ00015]MCO0635533.1 DMT family transporter [Lutimaribacter sp. EGI FJ00014]